MSDAVRIDLASLSQFPLPSLDAVGDKEGRGQVLAVAGGAWVPGAPVLTGLAALRVGAGKLQLAAPARAALHLGLAVPEAGVIAVDVTYDGEIAAPPPQALCDAACGADAVVVGPGMGNREAAGAVSHALMGIADRAGFVIDAAAMTGLDFDHPAVRRQAGRLVLTPHAGEMAKLIGESKDAVEREPLEAGRRLASRAGAVVAMKGASTWIVTPDGRAWRHDDGAVGLATSGSGDVLAGVIAGLLARGAPPLVATLWSVCLHAGAGARLADRIGAIGFLARELLDELPGVMADAGGCA